MRESPEYELETASTLSWHHRELAERIHGIEPRESDQSKREHIFLSVIFDRFLDDLEEELLEEEWGEEEIHDFFLQLEQYDDDLIRHAIALPKEIRQKLFRKYGKQIHSREKHGGDIAKELAEKNREYGFTIGYHVSDQEIVPLPNGTWNILPTELDDRDNMHMAYYSLDYEHMYRDRSSRHLYLVRGMIGPHTSHKKDGNNNWGRAPFLSVISTMSLQEADEIVERTLDELRKKDATSKS